MLPISIAFGLFCSGGWVLSKCWPDGDLQVAVGARMGDCSRKVCSRKFDELEIPDRSNNNSPITSPSFFNPVDSDFQSLLHYIFCLRFPRLPDWGQIMFELKLFCSERLGLLQPGGFLLTHLLPERLNGDWFWLPPSFKVISLFKETGFQGRVILIDLCSELWPRFSVIWV